MWHPMSYSAIPSSYTLLSLSNGVGLDRALQTFLACGYLWNSDTGGGQNHKINAVKGDSIHTEEAHVHRIREVGSFERYSRGKRNE